ncbi:unnamed protein product [Rhodiola kirilowii]
MAETPHSDPDATTTTSNSRSDNNGSISNLGLAFALYLATAGAVNRDLAKQVEKAEEELEQMRSRRKEDAKANARVVEIFASHRHAWQQEERRLHREINGSAAEAAELRAKVAEMEEAEGRLKETVEELRRDVSERTEMIEFLSRRMGLGFCLDENKSVGMNEFNPEIFSSAVGKFWSERTNFLQDTQYEPVEARFQMKHFVARRESPWKVDGESSGVSSKLKLLEQELLKLEKVGLCGSSKVPSLLRKQAKRYQALAGKIDDLCKRMQASDPCAPNLTTEFRTQRQTEFLLEAFRLQQRASETAQKQIALQNDTGKSFQGDEVAGQANLMTKRSFDSIKNNFKDIQRNLEIWLARIIGDLEGILARDGASRLREYYISRYPFVQ